RSACSGAWQHGIARQRIASEERVDLLRRAPGALQHERAQRALAAGDGEAVVEHRAGRGAGLRIGKLRRQDADAVWALLEPGPGPRVERAHGTLQFKRRTTPV